MDAIEVTRQRAERLHADAISHGSDPCNLYEFALAEAHRRDLEVTRVAKGDPRLHGARALFDPRMLILHERCDDEFTEAFLIAHEIGHVEFDGLLERSETLDVDPLRSAEAVPVGVDRVADYSRRQRREVQMDLFAREFLMPRSWLRDLHVQEGASASGIAARLAAPHAAVSQQLLDALLLPLVELSTEPDDPDRSLTPVQAEAATHDGSPFLLEAGPGTGKTQTLVGRVAHLIGKGADPQKILILTFSNKAAGELSARIASIEPQAAASIWAGTFHGFGLDIIRRFHDRLGLPASPRLLDRSDAIELLEEEYTRLELVHFRNLWDPCRPLADILSAISRAKDEVVDAARYRSLAEEMRRAAVDAFDDDAQAAAERHVEIATVFDFYERLKTAKGCIDLGDLVSLPVQLCESAEDVREHLKSRYEHVLVDEYQDVNRSSVRLLKAIVGDGRNLWVVGDVKQSIYRFRGASAYNMARFDRMDFPGGRRGRLTKNYRSSEEIVKAFLKFASGIPSVQGSDVSLEAARGKSGRPPEYRFVDRADSEVAAVAEAIEEMRKDGFSYREQAVLSSGNDRLGRFAYGLERLGIPVLYLGSLFERDEIKELLSLISLVVDGRAMGLVRIAATDRFAVPLADVSLLLSHLASNELAPLGWAEALDDISGLSPDGRAALQSIGRILDVFQRHADPWRVLCAVLLDHARIAAQIASSRDLKERTKGLAIWQFMNFVRCQPPGPGLPISRLLNRIRRMMLHSDERDLRQLPSAARGLDAVKLMTMHGSKGLEFPVVHIPGLNQGSLPRSPSLSRKVVPPDGMIEGAEGGSVDAVRAALVEEQECLFFVALSRAKDRLLLYSPTKKSNGYNWQKSAFIERLTNHLSVNSTAPSLRLPANQADALIQLTVEGSFQFSEHQLSLYERCPRRFLYTHILAVGGRRKETAFMQLHVAVQKAIDATSTTLGRSPSFDELAASLETTWSSHGPATHGYQGDYRRIALQLLRTYAEMLSTSDAQPIPRLELPVPGGVIVITPQQVVKDGDGRTVMRRVQTGHGSAKDKDSLSSAAFSIAAAAHSPGCLVELVHLSDSNTTPIKMTGTVTKNRIVAIEKLGEDIGAGVFPQNETDSCPRCPSFFICGPLPVGPLTKKFK